MGEQNGNRGIEIIQSVTGISWFSATNEVEEGIQGNANTVGGGGGGIVAEHELEEFDTSITSGEPHAPLGDDHQSLVLRSL